MEHGTKAWLLAMAIGSSSWVMAQDVDIEAQNINIEFESYGSCPLYLVPGTDDYDLCREQQRQYDNLNHRTVIKYEYPEVNLTPLFESRSDRFNVRERYE